MVVGTGADNLIILSQSANSTATEPRTFVDSTLRTAAATFWVCSALALLATIFVSTGDNEVPLRMISVQLLAIYVVLEAAILSNIMAYWLHLSPCVFTECTIDLEVEGSAAHVAAVMFVSAWGFFFVLLVLMKPFGLRGPSIFSQYVDDVVGLNIFCR